MKGWDISKRPHWCFLKMSFANEFLSNNNSLWAGKVCSHYAMFDHCRASFTLALWPGHVFRWPWLEASFSATVTCHTTSLSSERYNNWLCIHLVNELQNLFWGAVNTFIFRFGELITSLSITDRKSRFKKSISL